MDVLVTGYKSKKVYFWKNVEKKIVSPVPVSVIPNNYIKLGINSLEYLEYVAVPEKGDYVLWDQVDQDSKDLILSMSFPSKRVLMDHLIAGYDILRPGGQILMGFNHINLVKKITSGIKASGNPWITNIKRDIFPFTEHRDEEPVVQYICSISKPNPSLRRDKRRQHKTTPPSSP
jgi:hypothetical protein